MIRLCMKWRLLALVLALPVSTLSVAQSPSVDLEFDFDAPLAPLPELGVEWPEMTAEIAVPSTVESVSDEEGGRRYAVAIEGLDLALLADIDAQFDVLSTLKQGDGKPANVAQIDRRAREDSDLLITLLRSKGYYDAEVEPRIDGAPGERLTVALVAEPGPLYTFASVGVEGLASTGSKAAELRETFAVNENEAVDSLDVVESQVALETTIKAQGYPFAKVNEPEVVVDHDTRTATLVLNVDPGGQRKVGQFIVKGDRPPFGEAHVATISRIKSGEIYDQTMIDDLKRALVATGLVSVVQADPVPASDPELADIAVTLDRAPPRTIAGEIGYGSGEGFRTEVSWTHRNLIRPEGAVTFRGVLGTEEQNGGAILRQSNFRDRDRILTARLIASNINRRAFDARTVEFGAGLERVSTIIWQKRWTWSGGFELLASDERDARKIVGAGRKTFFIGAVAGSVGYDTSDNLLDPTRGFRLNARIAPEVSFQSGTNGYVRAQIDGSTYVPIRENIVIAGRARVGSIVGAGNFSIAPSRRLYAGGGGSIRGFGLQKVGPRDVFNDPVGGRALVEFSLEARVRFGVFAVVPFIDGGNVYASSTPKISGFRYGAGIGGRYHSAFGPIRIDVATPINPRSGDSPVAIYVSLGQAF